MKLYAIKQTLFCPPNIDIEELELDSCWNIDNGILGVFNDRRLAEKALLAIADEYQWRPSTKCYSMGWDYADFSIDDGNVTASLRIIEIIINKLYYKGLE